MVFKPIHSAHRPRVHVPAPPRPATTHLSSERNQRPSDMPYDTCKRCRSSIAIWYAIPCAHLLYCERCRIQLLSLGLRRCSICLICRVRIVDLVRSGGPRPAAAPGSGGPRPAAASGSGIPQPAAAAAGAPAGSQPAAAAAAAAADLPPTTAVAAALAPTTVSVGGPRPAAASGSGVPQPAAAAAGAPAGSQLAAAAAAAADDLPPTTAVAAALAPTTVSVHSTSATGAPQPDAAAVSSAIAGSTDEL